MSLVGVCGDVATTTAVVLAATWPVQRSVVVELDGRGGSLAAWFGLTAEPSLSDAVTAPDAEPWSWVRTGPHGATVLTAPVLATEARRAVAEARSSLLPRLAASDDLVGVVDLGPDVHGAGAPVHLFDHLVLVHRQRPAGQHAEAVRVRRFLSSVAVAVGRGASPTVVVVGRVPYRPASILRMVTGTVEGIRHGAVLADDPLAAAVVCGGTRISTRRFIRLPLLRGARRLATELARGDGGRPPDPSDRTDGAGVGPSAEAAAVAR